MNTYSEKQSADTFFTKIIHVGRQHICLLDETTLTKIFFYFRFLKLHLLSF